MKIKTNVRAGSQTRNRSSSTDSTSVDTSTVVVYVPPVTRCVY